MSKEANGVTHEETGLTTYEIYQRALKEGAPWVEKLAKGEIEEDQRPATRVRAYVAISKLLNELMKRDAAGMDGKKGGDGRRVQDEVAARVAAAFEDGED